MLTHDKLGQKVHWKYIRYDLMLLSSELGPSRKGGGAFLSLYRFGGLVPVKIQPLLFVLIILYNVALIHWHRRRGRQLLLAKVRMLIGRIGIFHCNFDSQIRDRSLFTWKLLALKFTPIHR